LKPREITAAQPDLAHLAGLPRDQGEPVFAAPWQASAFALTVSLSRQGHFSLEGVGSGARRRTQGELGPT
jgi:hypothetical protein